MRRILGFIMLVSGLVGIVLSIVAIPVGWRLVGDLGQAIDGNLQLTADSLTTVQETLLLTKDVAGQINEGMVTVEATADDVALAMETMQPLVAQVSVVTTEEVPQSIANLQSTIPSLIEVASAIDRAMVTLDSLRLLTYEPDVPFGESVATLGTSLEGVPGELRDLGTYLDETDQNLETLSQDTRAIADRLDEINASTAELEPLIDDYIATTSEIRDATRLAQTRLSGQVNLIRIVITGILLWLGLAQIASIYLGWNLFKGHQLVHAD